MPTYAVRYHYVDDAAALARHRPEHRGYLHSLAEAGHLLGSGPFTDAPGALLVFTAASAEDVAGWLAADPFARAGLVADAEVRAWDIVLGPWAVQSASGS